MSYIHPALAEHLRRRWERADAYRFAAPGTPEAKMPGTLHPWAEVARQEQAAADEAKARALAEQHEFEREVLRLRHDFAKLKLEYELRRFQQKYSPDQPRVPAGNPDGGQWTSGGGSGAGRDIGRDSGRSRSTDFSAQARRAGPPRAPTSVSREVYLDQLTARAEEAVSRVQQLDPNWRPPQSVMAPDRGENIEARIRAREDIVREADARFLALSRAGEDAPYPMPNPRTTAEVLAPSGQLVGARDLRAGYDTRVLSSAEFETIRQTLMGGARRVDPGGGYDGVWYQREDGSTFGLRLSGGHGLTLEVIRSDHAVVTPGLRFHQR
jgi:hypothetical protein